MFPQLRDEHAAHFRFAAAFEGVLALVFFDDGNEPYSVAFLELQELGETFILVDSIVILRDAASKDCRLPNKSFFSNVID